jgi:hypothetical protein
MRSFTAFVSVYTRGETPGNRIRRASGSLWDEPLCAPKSVEACHNKKVCVIYAVIEIVGDGPRAAWLDMEGARI